MLFHTCQLYSCCLDPNSLQEFCLLYLDINPLPEPDDRYPHKIYGLKPGDEPEPQNFCLLAEIKTAESAQTLFDYMIQTSGSMIKSLSLNGGDGMPGNENRTLYEVGLSTSAEEEELVAFEQRYGHYWGIKT